MKRILLIIVLFGIYLGVSADHITLPQKDGHVFSNLHDEYKLVSYFLNTNQKQYYKKLDTENKWEFLFAFWKIQDPNPETEDNEFLLEIITRIKYSNRHFSHFKKGWKTDMGKIYIKHGEPFEILELTNTGSYTKLTQREYQIWKYRISSFLTFLFIDPQQHRDFRLIFRDGDEQEGSWREWRDYLGTDFDAKLLQ
ncbi:MAG: GWxTD domain-containing protein [Candidatus Cloacimonetes bacterium]|nr:GWxTD domain-containing protein [Candidatus Cloacimonadota bacterium]